MKRRHFLRQASTAIVGGAVAWTGPASRRVSGAEATGGGQPTAAGVLITSGETPLAQTLASKLAAAYSVRLTAVSPLAVDLPLSVCDLEPGEATAAVARGMQAIVHVPPAVPPDGELALVDRWPRQTYHLLRSAADAGVQRVVYLSSLEVVSSYDAEYLVDEDWQPVVFPGNGQLLHQLGEFCCREFARERKLQVVVLRLGRLVRDATRPVAGKDTDWLDERDAVQAIERALAAGPLSDGRGLDSWCVCHVTSGVPGSRFPINRAARLLGYEPRFGI